jgi:tRNA threonylcarbamoyladenosine biosynthesis protein TsaB
VAKGPGSFTGVRIGVAAAKGLAWAAEKPVCGVSTLYGMAQQQKSCQGIICPVMDARRSQVYNALFASDGETLTRLTEDRAISLEELKKELEFFEKRIFLVGDGSKLCYNTLHEEVPLVYPPAHLEMQRASGVAMAAELLAREGELMAPQELTPNYLRLSQAERERLQKLNQSKGDK